ncbi:IS110 family transposase [Candidatus Palauibacter sp.]|uniref:IS110 family transposase n=1 Tax=Candidatus Palauibacter sp. TaxID=3101350 RepID=UPI003C7040DC
MRRERTFRHGGAGLAEMAEWIVAGTGAAAGEVPVAIEVPHGPVVESLMDRGYPVYAVNPKQLDRFRDRFSPAGAKDDSRDARVLADALRTDRGRRGPHPRRFGTSPPRATATPRRPARNRTPAADRLLAVARAMLRTQTVYDANHARVRHAA